jgi:hypothetical protein
VERTRTGELGEAWSSFRLSSLLVEVGESYFGPCGIDELPRAQSAIEYQSLLQSAVTSETEVSHSR